MAEIEKREVGLSNTQNAQEVTGHEAEPPKEISGEKGFVKKSWKEIAAERREQLKEITDRLEAGVKEYMSNDVQFKKVLETMAKFHHYSANNVLLIAMQMPTATHVASYTNWQKNFNRQVKKGQKGLSIIAPAPYKKKTEREVMDPATGKPVLDSSGSPQMEEVEITVPRFKVTKVFDLSQTFGEPLPELDVPELEGNAENYALFMDALQEASPVPIRFDQIPGEAKGYYDNKAKEIVIRNGMSEVQTMKTAVHEVVHARLHDRDIMRDQGVIKSREAKEIEAEASAFTVLSHFKIDTSDYSIPYLGSFSAGQDTRILRESMETIRITSSQIIDEVTDYMTERMKERDIDRFTIYQIKEDSPGRDFLFMGMDFVKEHGLSVKGEYYQEIYQAPLKEGDTLDSLYARFNRGNYPADYKGHSMSMSDVVVLHKAGSEQDQAFYVDRFGFTEVPEFVIDKQQWEKEAGEVFQPVSDTPFPEEKPLETTHEEPTAQTSSPTQDDAPASLPPHPGDPAAKPQEEKTAPGSPQEPALSFYVAECMDFPVMGEYHDGLTLRQAAELYAQLPDSRMAGGKGIGVLVNDGQELSVRCTLVTDGAVREDAFKELLRPDQSVPVLQETIQEARKYFPENEHDMTVKTPELTSERTSEKSAVKEDPAPAHSEKDSVRNEKTEPGSRRTSVLAALREHQKNVERGRTGTDDRTHTQQKKKGDLAL